MLFFHKKKKSYEMDIAQASDMLKNVFAACDQKPNETPLDILMLRQKANTRFFSIGRGICILFMLLLFIVPFVFPHSNAVVTVTSESEELRLVSDYADGDVLILTLGGDDIDYASCYMSTRLEDHLLPLAYNEADRTITFPYVGEEANLFLFNKEGKELHLVIVPKE